MPIDELNMTESQLQAIQRHVRQCPIAAAMAAFGGGNNSTGKPERLQDQRAQQG